MNEKILLRFFHEDTPVPITSVDPNEGIVLANEISADPIAGGLSVTPAEDAISQDRFKRISMIEDWRDGRFRVKVTRDGDRLVLTGGGKVQPAKNLPAIGYHVELRLKDTKLRQSKFRIRLTEGGKQELEVRLQEPKKVKFVDLKDWDAVTRQIAANSNSMLDGISAAQWLARPVVRSVRKVCLLNLLAQMRTLPGTRDSLCRDVDSVLLAGIDRAVMRVGQGFLPRMRELTSGSNPVFGEDSGPLHPTHLRTRDRVAGAAAPQYKLYSFRQKVSNTSLQIIVGEPPSAEMLHYAEVDIDLGNPFVDLAGFGTHLFELIDPAATNHFDLATSVPLDFRYYSFV